MITNIEQFVKVVKDGMKIAGVRRLSIGQQIVVKVSLEDFIRTFGHETKRYRLGSEIRIDMNNVTYVADDENGITKEEAL